MSQLEYATAVGASDRQVRDWESGRVTCPQTWVLIRMHGLHGTVAPEDLGFRSRRRAKESAERTEGAVYRRDLLALVTTAALTSQPVPAISGLLATPETSGAIGTADVQRVHAVNTALTGTDLLVGGGAVQPGALLAQYRTAAALLHGTYQRKQVRAAMHSAVAHLGSTVGFMLFDQGRHLQARQVYLASLRVGTAASDRMPLRAIICSELARQALHLGALAEADELVRIAHGADAEIGASCRSMLHAVHATVAATAGNLSATVRYIGLAEHEFARADQGTDPDWIRWFDSAELAGTAGEALALLAVHHEQLRDQAAERLSTSAATHGPGEQRSAALAWIRLAGIHAARGDNAAAAAAIGRAVDTAARLQSPRVAEELRSLRPLIRQANHPDLAEAEARIASQYR